MNRRTPWFGLVIVLAASGSALAGDVDVIVGFKSKADAKVIEKRGGKADGDAIGKALAARVPSSAIAALRADPDVAYVEEDGIVEIQGQVDSTAKPGGSGGGSTQPAQTTPWGITKVNGGLSATAGGGVTVAVIDTGVDLSHPDLVDRLVTGKTFVSRTSSANDDNGHGTHCAGTIGATSNAIGVIGVAPGVSILPVKVLDRNGSGTWSAVANGIRWAADKGANIGSMSLGGGASSTLADACTYAVGKNTMLVAASGNDGSSTPSYPAGYSNVVAVGATDSNDNIASFSNFGPHLDVSAPGVSVYSTYKGSSYATLSGTSMATPHAAGVCALIWAAVKAASGLPTPTGVQATLQSNAVDKGTPGFDNYFGYGIVRNVP